MLPEHWHHTHSCRDLPVDSSNGLQFSNINNYHAAEIMTCLSCLHLARAMQGMPQMWQKEQNLGHQQQQHHLHIQSPAGGTEQPAGQKPELVTMHSKRTTSSLANSHVAAVDLSCSAAKRPTGAAVTVLVSSKPGCWLSN